MGNRNWIRPGLTWIICLAICCFLYGLWHELIGHGLVGVLLGGSIDSVHLFSFKVFPNFGFSGIPGGVGLENMHPPGLCPNHS